MRALDTNVVARTILRDNSAQSALAVQIMSEPALLLTTVALELAWVLKSAGKMDSTAIADSFAALLEFPNLTIPDRPQLAQALMLYRDGADFADALHLCCAGSAKSFATFDRNIAGLAAPITVELLTA